MYFIIFLYIVLLPSSVVQYMDTDFHSELSVSLWYDILCFLTFVLFTVYVLLYITVLLPVGVIKDDDDNQTTA